MSNVKYKVKNIESIFNGVRAIYDDVTEQKDELERIGKFARDRIVAETRKGFDLTNEGAKQPELSPNYIGYRKRLGKRHKKAEKVIDQGGTLDEALAAGKLGLGTPNPDPQFFRPAKSNLTLTGQLLNSIDYQVNTTKKSIVITPTGTRDDGKTNLEVATELAERKTANAPKGRRFLGLDERGFRRIRNVIIEAIRRVALKKGY